MYYGKHRTQGIRKKSILYPTSQNHNILAFSNIFLIFCLILFYILIVNICYAAAKSLQSCPTLCDPIDGSPPELLQARTLEWVTISFSNAWKWNVKVKLLSHVRLLATPWTAAYQAPPSMGFSRQEHWSGLPFPSPMHESETWKWSCSVVSDSSWPHELQPTRLLRPWEFPGKSTGVRCHCLLQFWTDNIN